MKSRLSIVVDYRGADLGDLVFDGPHGQRFIPPTCPVTGKRQPWRKTTLAPMSADLTLDRLIAIDGGAKPTEGEAESLGMLLEWPPPFFLLGPIEHEIEWSALFICGDGENRSETCLFCGAPATLLCDGLPKGDSPSTSCDAEMCAGCAHEVRPDEHLCPRCRPKRAPSHRTGYRCNTRPDQRGRSPTDALP